MARLVKDHPNYVFYSAELDRWLLKVPGNALQFDEDLSTFWIEHVADTHGEGPAELAEPPPGRSLVYVAEVDQMLSLGLTVKHTPDRTIRRGCAHTSFFRSEDLDKPGRKALSTDIAMLMECVSGEPTPPPPGA